MRALPLARPTVLALSLAAALAGGAPAVLGDDVEILRDRAPVTDVTVYSQKALVLRRASAEVKAAGTHTVRFTQLPSLLSDDSVRVRAEKGTTILSTRTVARPVADSARPAVAALTAEIRTLEQEIAAQRDEHAVAQAQAAFAEKVLAASADEKSALVQGSAGALDERIAWAMRAIAESQGKRRAITAKIEEADRRLAPMRQRLRELSNAAGVEKDIEVDLETKGPGTFRVEVEYVTDGASWRPFYDLRADPEAKEIDVTYLGVVTQRTGDDWQGVKLTLSTARPELGASAPELSAHAISMRPRYTGSWGDGYGRHSEKATAPMTEASAAAGGATTAAVAEPPMIPGEVQHAVAEDRGTTVAFQVPARETIPSDGKEKRTTIGRATAATDNRYVTVPKLSPHAYLQSKIKNPFPYAMLAGGSGVFFGVDFVGRGGVKLVPAGESLEVHLGVDERVQVERKIMKRFRDTKGIISTDVRERYEYEIAVKNARDIPVAVTVCDQLPISRDEDIRVEDTALKPEPNDRDEKREKLGERRWDVRLPARSEQKIQIGYTVRFPEKREGDVIGLER